ncbi:GIY-YIG nuclease family protein [Candidatus Woesebacteria bacterium]|nr:GIY-YIG nuclease family protein [Candidatus Woesebacteria bacterium]
MRTYFVYILASKKNGTLYIGVTSNLRFRIWQHKNKVISGFTSQYEVTSLVYFEEHSDINEAISREKYLKGKKREYKIKLIENLNPEWDDLSLKW